MLFHTGLKTSAKRYASDARQAPHSYDLPRGSYSGGKSQAKARPPGLTPDLSPTGEGGAYGEREGLPPAPGLTPDPSPTGEGNFREEKRRALLKFLRSVLNGSEERSSSFQETC